MIYCSLMAWSLCTEDIRYLISLKGCHTLMRTLESFSAVKANMVPVTVLWLLSQHGKSGQASLCELFYTSFLLHSDLSIMYLISLLAVLSHDTWRLTRIHRWIGTSDLLWSNLKRLKHIAHLWFLCCMGQQCFSKKGSHSNSVVHGFKVYNVADNKYLLKT